jgi:hypothetical protein
MNALQKRAAVTWIGMKFTVNAEHVIALCVDANNENKNEQKNRLCHCRRLLMEN